MSEDPHVLFAIHGCGSQTRVPSSPLRLVHEPLGWSLYAYAANSPVDLRDPLGLVPLDKGYWRCPFGICPPRPGCTTLTLVGEEAYTLDETRGRFVKGILCRYHCRSSEEETFTPCDGPYF